MKKMTFRQIQDEIVERYRVNLDEHSTCYGRMHAHVKERRVCKWHQKNSIQATFDLFHEIGHIETTKSKMRRCESEYHATVWAIERCKEYGLTIPKKTLNNYQRYIFDELDRGIRRGGRNYPSREELLLPDVNPDEWKKKSSNLTERPHKMIYVTWRNCMEMESIIDEVVSDVSRRKFVTLESETMNDDDCRWVQECVEDGLKNRQLNVRKYYPSPYTVRMNMWIE